MTELSSWFAFMAERSSDILRLGYLHLLLVVFSGVIATAIALPIAVFSSRPGRSSWKTTVLGIANILQAVPTLAVIGIASALFALAGRGIGWWPAVTALIAYSILPILANSLEGLSSVPMSTKKAAYGLGLAQRDVLFQVEIPLAMPLIIAGIRTAMVINVGTAALAAAIGAECLGGLIFQGIAVGNLHLILAGAVPTALLAIIVDGCIGLIQNRLLGRQERIA